MDASYTVSWQFFTVAATHLAVTIWVAIDAKKRGANPIWRGFVVLVLGIPGWLHYLFTRPIM